MIEPAIFSAQVAGVSAGSPLIETRSILSPVTCSRTLPRSTPSKRQSVIVISLIGERA